MAHMNRDHGLNVQHILNAAELADRKVHIVLKWDTDEVAYGVLRSSEHLGVIRSSLCQDETRASEHLRTNAYHLLHMVGPTDWPIWLAVVPRIWRRRRDRRGDSTPEPSLLRAR